jgi:hypothetical protein
VNEFSILSEGFREGMGVAGIPRRFQVVDQLVQRSFIVRHAHVIRLIPDSGAT